MIDRFRALSQSQQAMLAALACLMLVAILSVIWFAFLRTDYEPLFSRLRAADAATIVAELDRKKMPYELADGGATILVPASAVDRTRLDVMSEDLPLKGTVGFELFNKSDLGITDFAQKINYQRALQGELERTIMALDGVDTARVHLSLGEDRIFRDDRVPPKASVTIRMVRGAQLTEIAAQGVRRLVAAAVPNLDIANVVILNEMGQVISAAPAVSAAAQTASPLEEERQAIAQYYEAKIRQALSNARLTTETGVSVWIDSADDAGGIAVQALTDWTPATRAFPLEITLTPGTPLDPAAQDFLRNLVKASIASASVQDDVVTIGVLPKAQPAPNVMLQTSLAVPRRPAVPLGPKMTDDNRDWAWEMLATLALIVLLFSGFIFLIWRASRRRGLTAHQRADFAVRLKAALREGAGHAAS